jgi:predicted small secreted protein
MKTTKTLITLGIMTVLTACNTTKQRYAGNDIVSVTNNKQRPVLFYVDRNNQIRPFYMPPTM